MYNQYSRDQPQNMFSYRILAVATEVPPRKFCCSCSSSSSYYIEAVGRGEP